MSMTVFRFDTIFLEISILNQLFSPTLEETSTWTASFDNSDVSALLQVRYLQKLGVKLQYDIGLRQMGLRQSLFKAIFVETTFFSRIFLIFHIILRQ
jgi:hypothetical protein